jgi:ParB family chromosome partitioning protein
MGHARSIAGLEEISSQLMVLGEIMSKGLSVRDTERLVSSWLNKGTSTKGKKTKESKPGASGIRSAELNQIQQQLRSMLGVPVVLNYQDNGTGNIQIPFKSDKELNYILDLLEGIDKES